jgi:signal transduction histidine kinase
MTLTLIVQCLLIGAGAALGAGLLAAIALRLVPRAPLAAHLAILVLAAVGGVAGGIGLTAQAMFINEKDTMVALTVVSVAGVVSTIVAIGLGLRLSRDARALGADARRLGAGEAVGPARRATAELDAVQADLVSSSAQLEAARAETARGEHARRDLVTRIAHDVMASLASIQAIAETLGDGTSADPSRHARQLTANVSRVQRLVGDLFELSRIDAGTLGLRRDRLSLGDLVSDLVAEHSDWAARHGRALVTQVRTDAVLDADAAALSRAIVNVLVNALEHAGDGGAVTVTLTTDERAARLCISDTGPGFSDDALAHALEPGWRGEDARSAPATELAAGAGLGLAITRAIVAEHGGTVTLHRDPSGARVDLVLPLAMST